MEQDLKIVASIDAIGCNLYVQPSNFVYPDRMFTPGGVDLIDALCRYFEEKHNLQIGRLIANIILKKVGSALPFPPDQTTTVDTIQLSCEEIRQVIAFQIRIMLKNIGEAIPAIIENISDQIRIHPM